MATKKRYSDINKAIKEAEARRECPACPVPNGEFCRVVG